MAEDKLTFAAIVLVAIVAIVGLIGFMGPGLTGFVARTGTLGVTFAGSADIILTDAATSFGSGYVNASAASAVIDSNGTKTSWINTTAFPATDYMTLENNGSTLVNVTIQAGSSAATFIGGTGPAMSFYGKTAESGACSGTLVTAYTTLSEASATVICPKLEYLDTKDNFDIGYALTIPVDVVQGAKSNTITFTAIAQ